MNKFLTKVAKIFLGLSMAAGVGVAVSTGRKDASPVHAAEELAYTLDGTVTGGSSGYTTASDITQSSVSWKVYGNTTMNPWRIGNGGTGSAGTRLVQSQGVVSTSNITKIVITTANVGITPSAITLKVGTSAGNGSVTNTSTTWATPTKTIERPSGANWAGRYFEIGFTVGSTKSKYFQLTKIEFYRLAETPATSVTVTGNDGTSLAPGETRQLGTTVLPAGHTDTITWSSSADGVATVSSTGLVTAVAAGTTTITARANASVSGTTTITVEAPSTPFITPSKSTTSGYTGQHESISFTYGNLNDSLSVVSDDTNVVSIGTPSYSAGSGSVQFNFVGAGTDIDVNFKDGSTSLGKVTVSVIKTAFETSPAASATVKVAKTITLSAVLNSGGSISWDSNDSTVATVSNGVVTGVAPGSATITATSVDDNSVSADCEVTVVSAPAYETGFESSDEFISSTTYNNDTPANHGETGKQWSVLCGSPTTTQPRTGSQDMHLRYYNSVGETPYMEMTWDVTDGHEMTFYAKGHDAARTISVEYSTDSGANWSTLIAEESCPSTDYSLVTATIPSYTAKARFRINLTSTVDKKGVFIDDLEITTMAEPTIPAVTITSKDGAGKMSGIIGDIQEVTYSTAHDTGLTLSWTLTDTESVVDWENPYVEFLKVGADATLTAELIDGNSDVVASDSVTLHTLAPSLDIKVGGTSRANYSLYEGDSITITVTASNQPSSATLSWSSDDTNEDYSTFNTSTGVFEATAAGTVKVRVDMMYSSNSIANDILNITINALGEPTLVISAGTGKTSYKFGEELDTTGWTATYTDDHGVAHADVIGDLTFDSIRFLGTKGVKATYLGTQSNAVDVTVTNNGATCETETILTGSGFTSSSMPSGWSQSGASSDYAASHAPYRLKFDGTGDTVTATVNTSASVIYAGLGVKLVGGASTCSFTVTAKDSSGNSVATGTINFSGSQNEILSDTATLSNSSGKTITSIEFYFNKGSSNVGVGTGSISVDNTDAFAPAQALAYARYFLEQTDGYCEATISSSVKTNLINEFGWMIAESKAVFKDADIVRGKGASYEDDISEALSRYINMLEDKGYTDSEFLNLGDEIINKASSISPLINVFNNNTNTVAIIVIISMVSVTAIGGYFFIKKRKEQ